MTEILVIGAGVAGMTAALYALRNGKKVTLLERNAIGGQIAESPRVENFPTIKSLSGVELADRLFDQVTELGVEFKFGEALSIKKEENVFIVNTEFDEIKAKSVIIATGVKHRKLNLPNEENLIGHGVSYCALCDGAFYKGEDVVLIGDGNTALQYALLLSSTSKSVHVFTLFDKFFGDGKLVQAVRQKENVKITHNARLTSFIGDKELKGLVFDQNGKNLEVVTPALFVAIGQVPDNKIFEGLVDLSNDGYILADENLTTKTAGLFVAGDCRTKKVRQLTTACSDGAIAGTNACTYLESL